MPRLILQFENRVLKEYPTGVMVTIGRLPDNMVVLRDEHVIGLEETQLTRDIAIATSANALKIAGVPEPAVERCAVKLIGMNQVPASGRWRQKGVYRSPGLNAGRAKQRHDDDQAQRRFA